VLDPSAGVVVLVVAAGGFGRTVGAVGAAVVADGAVRAVGAVEAVEAVPATVSGVLVGLVVCTMSRPLPAEVAVIWISCEPDVSRSSMPTGSECTVSM
jgi:hypothetical protein